MKLLERTLSAPGKLFLAGEYAVLWGGTARILAVGPRTHALVRSRMDRRVNVLLEGKKLSGSVTQSGVRWENPVTADFHFVARAIDFVFRTVDHEAKGLSVAFETSLALNGHKPGFGSSACATLLAVEAARIALNENFDSLKLALLAHRDAQGGEGSGGDVAVIFAGGAVRYKKYDEGAPFVTAAKRLRSELSRSPSVDLTPIAPPALPLAYAFSGQSTTTANMLKAVPHDDRRARFVMASNALGLEFERALIQGDFEAAKSAAAELQKWLLAMDLTRSEALLQVLRLAEQFCCAGKQSGAGGGDGCLLFGCDDEALDTFIAACTERGMYAMRISPETGLRSEAECHAGLSLEGNIE